MSIEVIKKGRPRAYPPRPTECTVIFWEALTKGKFQTTKCNDCNSFTFPPKPVCPHCWSSSVSWKELSGKGTLYSRTTIYAAPATFKNETPIHAGIIDLEEGIRIATQLLEDDPIPIDSAVEIVAILYSDGPLYGARKPK
ncbi:Zn-ribbon domain-containing OB-fold protein [Sneathiella sp.]|uniref:Zn-ribbon domain-containing OB-fold protein n=1 Tax=Sneathiella sp. TaxID=1964365 RepID=UPI002638B9AA|nr:Zn-ribbon domain-containing OB-fold protein [Sneathiella sp.]MDF2367109.1 Zn-ribbon domain-containing OB-fold protein [Sneathiella sp.]